jgi:hypothetical protein
MIAKVGVTAVFAASGDLATSVVKQGSPDYERLINVVHDAAISAAASCRPFAWRSSGLHLFGWQRIGCDRQASP